MLNDEIITFMVEEDELIKEAFEVTELDHRVSCSFTKPRGLGAWMGVLINLRFSEVQESSACVAWSALTAGANREKLPLFQNLTWTPPGGTP